MDAGVLNIAYIHSRRNIFKSLLKLYKIAVGLVLEMSSNSWDLLKFLKSP